MSFIYSRRKLNFLSGNNDGGECRHLFAVLICFYIVLINAPVCLSRHALRSSEEIQALSSACKSQGHNVDNCLKEVTRAPRSLPNSVKQQEDSNYWFEIADASLKQKVVTQKIIKSRAKNVIFFIGDGMGVSTVTATRIFKGQQDERLFGEEAFLNMEHLPNVALAKTFCQDSQVADSACSATAYLCGTLGNIATIGLTSNVKFRDCIGQQNKSNHVSSVLAWAQARGMSTGIVTTTRVTHATPTGTYASIADRDWENDKKINDSGKNADDCDDIAEQLVFGDVGKHINVILGGGRREMTPNTVLDVESNQPGLRTDGKNLIESWLQTKDSDSAKYVWNKEQLFDVDQNKTEYLLGLFSYSHMDYVADANTTADPSLAEMTKVAIDILSKNPNGYFLFVEGAELFISKTLKVVGLVKYFQSNHAHHDNLAQKSFIEAIAMDEAVLTAMKNSSEEETLLIVSSDHSHVMTISGYPPRGNPILGFAGISDVDNLPYTTISYANGIGYKHPGPNGNRYDLTNDPLFDLNYAQMTGLPMTEGNESHGGEDVPIYSRGPWAHLLTGVNHQSIIPHVIAYAACLDIPGKSNLKGIHCFPSHLVGIPPPSYFNGTLIPSPTI